MVKHNVFIVGQAKTKSMFRRHEYLYLWVPANILSHCRHVQDNDTHYAGVGGNGQKSTGSGRSRIKKVVLGRDLFLSIPVFLISSLFIVSPTHTDQSRMVVEVAPSKARQILLSQSRMKRSWAPMTMNRRTPTTTARVKCLSLLLSHQISDLLLYPSL